MSRHNLSDSEIDSLIELDGYVRMYGHSFRVGEYEIRRCEDEVDCWEVEGFVGRLTFCFSHIGILEACKE